MNKCEKFVRIIPNTIKDKSLKLLSFMERETRLELATSSLATQGNSLTNLYKILLFLHLKHLCKTDTKVKKLVKSAVSP